MAATGDWGVICSGQGRRTVPERLGGQTGGTWRRIKPLVRYLWHAYSVNSVLYLTLCPLFARLQCFFHGVGA